MITAKPEVVGNSIVFVNWSHPLNDYDIESIELLKPKHVITIVDTGYFRGAGSPKFHYWLNKSGIKTTGHIDDLLQNVDPNSINDVVSYYTVANTSTSYKPRHMMFPMKYEICWLSNCKSLVQPSYEDEINKSENANELPLTVENSEEAKRKTNRYF